MGIILTIIDLTLKLYLGIGWWNILIIIGIVIGIVTTGVVQKAKSEVITKATFKLLFIYSLGTLILHFKVLNPESLIECFIIAASLTIVLTEIYFTIQEYIIDRKK